MSFEGTGPQRSEGPATGGDAGSALASEISRRVAAILEAVEREAARLRAEARADAARYLDDARRRADEVVAERQRRIAAVSDDLLRKSEAVVARLDDAEPVRTGFENLVRALGDAAERLARETREAPPAPAAAPAFHERWVPPAPPPQRAPEPLAGPPAPGVHAAEPAAAPPAPPVERAPAEPTAPYPPPVEPTAPTPPPEPTPPPAEPEPPAASPPLAPPPGPEPPRFRPAQAGDPSPFTPREPAREPAMPGPGPGPGSPGASRQQGPPPRQWRQADDTRLVAMQMAIAGNTRGEVHDHLAAVLGVVDSDRMLDEIFGPGGSPEQRLPGTR
jgi:hypothetical protein